MFHWQTVALHLMEESDKQKKKKRERRSCDERKNPLKELNRIPRSNIKNSSGSICSSSSSVSIEVPKVCLWFLPSSQNSYPSSSSSSSRSHLQRNPKSFSKKPITTTSKSAPISTRPRSIVPCKETDLPKPRPTSQNSRRNPSFVYKWQSGKKPTSKTSQRSKLSADLSKPVKNPASESGRFGVKQKDFKQKDQESHGLSEFHFNVSDNLTNIENFTPVGKLVCGPSLNSAIVDDKPVGEDSNSANTIVTPPVEASVSPEIQCGSSNIVLDSTATPVCYGAGHLISGVTDKRKCRPRGILTIGGPIDSSGRGKISTCEDGGNGNADSVLTRSRTSLIPLPAEASMRWLSPQGKELEVQKGDSANAYRPLTSSTSISIASSPSPYCQFPSDLVSDSGDQNGSGNSDAITSTGKTRIVLLSLRRSPNVQGFSEPSSEIKHGNSSATSQARSSCKSDRMQKEVDYSNCFKGKKTPCSVDTLSCNNVVQTPTSDSSLDRHVGISWIDVDDCLRNEFNPGPFSLVETRLSPGSQMPMWDPLGLSSQLTDLTSPSHSIDRVQLQKNLDNCASWISDSTEGNVSLSQMRISWREGLASRIFDMDEFDCCRCLSDEDNNGDGSDELQHKSLKAFEVEEHDSFRSIGLRSPEFLDQEPEILRKGKEELSHVGSNICAESISTDAGGLVTSGDSDWSLYYKNQLFEV